MSLVAKQRIVVAMLAVFALWPVVHGSLVDKYLINPWRLFGWAMYCVPTYEPQIRFFGQSGERGGELVFPSGHPQAEIERIRFIRRRGQIGKWASAEVLAAQLFELYPHLDSLAIDVAHPIYQRDSRTFEPQLERMIFERRRDP